MKLKLLEKNDDHLILEYNDGSQLRWQLKPSFTVDGKPTIHDNATQRLLDTPLGEIVEV